MVELDAGGLTMVRTGWHDRNDWMDRNGLGLGGTTHTVEGVTFSTCGLCGAAVIECHTHAQWHMDKGEGQ